MTLVRVMETTAKDVRGANERGEELGLEPYKLAFYDALAQN